MHDADEEKEFIDEELSWSYENPFCNAVDEDDQPTWWKIDDNGYPLVDVEDVDQEDTDNEDISDKIHKRRNQNVQFTTPNGLMASRNRFGLTLAAEEAALREYTRKLKRKVYFLKAFSCVYNTNGERATI